MIDGLVVEFSQAYIAYDHFSIFQVQELISDQRIDTQLLLLYDEFLQGVWLLLD